MRFYSSFFEVANATRAFQNIGASGLTGSHLNLVMSALGVGVGQLGNGASTDMGAGGGGTSGGGGSGGHAPGDGGGMGGSGGTGGMGGGAGMVGGGGPHDSCQKNSTPPSPDPDDSLEPANPSPDKDSSGVGNGDQAPNTVPMPGDTQISPCLGGPVTTTKKPRGQTCSTNKSTI